MIVKWSAWIFSTKIICPWAVRRGQIIFVEKMTGWSFNSLKERLAPWEQDTIKFILLGLIYSSIVKPIAIGIFDHFSQVFKRVIVNSGYWRFSQICLLRPRYWPTKSLEQSEYNSRESHQGRTEWPASWPALLDRTPVRIDGFSEYSTSRKRHFYLEYQANFFYCVFIGYVCICG